MARDRLTYRQRDLAAALRAIKTAGMSIARIDVHQDGVDIILGEPPSTVSIPNVTAILQERLSNYEKPKRRGKTLIR